MHLTRRELIRERLLHIVGVHGPSAVIQHWRRLRELKRLSPWDAMTVKYAMIEAGMSPLDVEDLFGMHDQGCACWRCLFRVHAWVLRTQERWKAEHPELADHCEQDI